MKESVKKTLSDNVKGSCCTSVYTPDTDKNLLVAAISPSRIEHVLCEWDEEKKEDIEKGIISACNKKENVVLSFEAEGIKEDNTHQGQF